MALTASDKVLLVVQGLDGGVSSELGHTVCQDPWIL